MKDSIKLSPKYGVNPTMPVCFFCGEDTGDIALLGHIYEKDQKGRPIRGTDVEAPRRMLLDYEPCPKCKEKFSQGILFIEVTDEDTNVPEIIPGKYPTGAHVVITEDAFRRIFMDGQVFDPYSQFEEILKYRSSYLDVEVFRYFFKNV